MVMHGVDKDMESGAPASQEIFGDNQVDIRVVA
jgi:hypothetical protein